MTVSGELFLTAGLTPGREHGGTAHSTTTIDEDAGPVSDAATVSDAGEAASAMDAYARQVGRRLRTVREQRLFTLREVEKESDHEFPSSVVSAYERGERMMSVQRLDRLAQFYDVPISELLPRGGDHHDAPDAPEPALTVRLRRLDELEGEPFDRFRQLVGTIRDQRRDDTDDVVTLRSDDLRAVAAMFDVPAEEMADRMALLDLLA